MLLVALMLGVATLSARQIGDRYQGSAPALEGKIYVLICFVSETEWDENEMADYCGLIFEAEDWLVSQAKNYGKEVSFKNAYRGFSKPLKLKDIGGFESDDMLVDRISRVIKKTEYRTGLGFVNWVKHNTDCTGCMLLAVANQPGRSYSMAYNDIYDREKFFLEGSMLYTSFESGKPACAASIAHEMCHLFGAEDLYETGQQSAENEQRARELFPDDIMLSTSYDINKRKIDRFTAWLVGLTDEMEIWYPTLMYK